MDPQKNEQEKEKEMPRRKSEKTGVTCWRMRSTDQEEAEDPSSSEKRGQSVSEELFEGMKKEIFEGTDNRASEEDEKEEEELSSIESVDRSGTSREGMVSRINDKDMPS
jgi:hypothetical protein